MDSIRMIFQITKIYLFNEFKNYKNYFLIAAVFTLISSYMTGTVNYVKQSGGYLSPWLLPFMTEFVELRLIIYSGFLFYISTCTAGLTVSQQILIRTKNTIYQAGCIFSLIIQSISYTFLIAVSGIIMNLPYVRFEKGWGKILYSLSDPTISGFILGTLLGDRKILYTLTPVQGMSLSFLLIFLTCLLISLIVYIFSAILGQQSLGMIFGGFLILLDLSLPNFLLNPNNLLLISPLTYSNLGIMRISGYSSYPHVSTGVILLLIYIAILCVLIFIISKKRREFIYG